VLFGHEFVGSREMSVDLVLDAGDYAIMPCSYNPVSRLYHTPQSSIDLLVAFVFFSLIGI
jgi:hypothetical protein